MSMYGKNHYNIVIRLQQIKINGEKKKKDIGGETNILHLCWLWRLLNGMGRDAEKLSRKSLPKSVFDRLTGERARGWGSALPKQPGLKGPHPTVDERGAKHASLSSESGFSGHKWFVIRQKAEISS